MIWPLCVSNTRISVPLSEDVARRVPSKLSEIYTIEARQRRNHRATKGVVGIRTCESSASCAVIKVVFRRSYSSMRTVPRLTPGHASTVLDELGHRAQSPLGFAIVSMWSTSFKSAAVKGSQRVISRRTPVCSQELTRTEVVDVYLVLQDNNDPAAIPHSMNMPRFHGTE
jgi:hypothetical protein